MLLFTIINHFFIILFFKINFINKDIILAEKIACYFILFLIWYSYLVALFYNKEEVLLKKIIIIFSIIIWQYLFSFADGEIYKYFSNILIPFIIYFIIVPFSDYMLYNNNKFKKKLDNILLIYAFIVAISVLINIQIFYFLYLIHFVIMNLYPILVLLIYRKLLKQSSTKIIKKLIIFEIILIAHLIIAFLLDKYFHFKSMYNFGWYVYVGILIIFVHIKLLNSVLSRKIYKIYNIEIINFKMFFNMPIFIMFVSSLLIYDFFSGFLSKYIFMNILLFDIFVLIGCSYFIIIQLNKSRFSNLIKLNQKTENLTYVEQEKIEIANYLHDEVLQSLIAIKNLLSVQVNTEDKQELIDEFSKLIYDIRFKIDNYFPDFSTNLTLKQNIDAMINKLKSIYKRNLQINFDCDELLLLFSPYDILVYRITRELVNNSLKYSDNEVQLKIKVNNNIILISSVNKCEKMNFKYGKGLSFIKRNVEYLDGQFNLTNDNYFKVNITIPIDGGRCYENFVDRRS